MNSTNPTNPTNPTIIPILDLVRQYRAIRPEIDEAIRSVLESGEFILGPHVARFETAAAAYCGVRHAIGLGNGTDALLLSLKALGIGPGDGVLVPSFTFFATAGVVHNVGATPVFCDVDPKTFNIDPVSAREVLASHAKANPTNPTSPTNSTNPTTSDHGLRTRIKAIIPVHLYGQMADMDEVLVLADEFGLAVIEDAAQAIGAQYYGHVARGTWPVGTSVETVARSSWPVGTAEDDGKGVVSPQATDHRLQAASSVPQATGHKLQAGSVGSVGCFSFYPTKNLGAYGDAGMVTTNDDELADKIRLLRVHGAKPKYVHHVVGINSRLDALQAAILSVKLAHLDAWTAARQRLADRYDGLLAHVPGIVTPYRAPDRTHIFHQYTVRVTEGRRDALAAHLKAEGIGTMIYYPGPLHLQECFAHLGHREGDLPESERASHEVLSLPIFPELREEEQDQVVEVVRDFVVRGS